MNSTEYDNMPGTSFYLGLAIYSPHAVQGNKDSIIQSCACAYTQCDLTTARTKIARTTSFCSAIDWASSWRSTRAAESSGVTWRQQRETLCTGCTIERNRSVPHCPGTDLTSSHLADAACGYTSRSCDRSSPTICPSSRSFEQAACACTAAA